MAEAVGTLRFIAPDEPVGQAGEQEWDPGVDPDEPGPDDSGPIPHPLDRVWFHPSELNAYVERQLPSQPRGQWRGPAAVLVVGALLIGAVALVGDNGRA